MSRMFDELVDVIRTSAIVQQQVEAHQQHERNRRRPAWRKDSRTYRQKYPERERARHAVQRAVKDGRMLKPTQCMVGDAHCKGVVQAHHYRGYDRAHWLDVLWLCRHHHRIAHQH